MKIPDLPNFDRHQLEALKQAAELQKQLPDIMRAGDLFKQMPSMYEPPRIKPMIQDFKLPTQREINNYASAGVLLRVLEESYNQWKESLLDEIQPNIYAFLSNGDVVQVTELIEQGFHGIEIRGFFNGLPCLLLQHQNSLQFLCIAEPITEEKPKRRIGFHLREFKDADVSVDE